MHTDFVPQNGCSSGWSPCWTYKGISQNNKIPYFLSLQDWAVRVSGYYYHPYITKISLLWWAFEKCALGKGTIDTSKDWKFSKVYWQLQRQSTFQLKVYYIKFGSINESPCK